jgi:GH15 family glucan-1,4-alpha-glucosidase
MSEPGPGVASRYPPIGDYAFLGDCHTGALVSSEGSVDWLCLPRLDDGSYFGRLLDRDRGGWCAITPADPAARTSRRYLDGTLVLETEMTVAGGRVRVTDCLTMRPGGARQPYRQLLRVVDGLEGAVDLRVEVVPRFDYGQVRPWIRRAGHAWQALGGDDGLVVEGDVPLALSGLHDLVAEVRVQAGDRLRLSLRHLRPEVLDSSGSSSPASVELDRRLEQTVAWWRDWSAHGGRLAHDRPALLRSATVLKALTQATTGAIAAAATTSLPEAPGGPRNWDYRASWVRDSVFALRSLAELGYTAEADGFRRFIQRSAAGSAQELQIMYGLGGERRLVELTLDDLEGFGGARPVRIGNAAARQHQHDVYGELLDLAWAWHQRGKTPGADDWRFLSELVNAAADRWTTPDHGIWELRGQPLHLVHSKVMCWVALDRGLRLATDLGFPAPVAGWTATREAIRAAVERHGYDPLVGCSPRRSGGPSWTRRCCCCPPSASSPGTTSACSAPSTRSAQSWRSTGCCYATGHPTASKGPRVPLWPARSGWPSAWPARPARPKPRLPSPGRRRPPTTWDCSPRSSTRPPGSCSATTPRRSPTSPISPPPSP